MDGTPFRDARNRPLHLTNLYRGTAAFLVCGGPSASQCALERLDQRGILIASFNHNLAVLPDGVRPHIWTHSDPSRKFHDAIWRDPGILKFAPVKEWYTKRNLWKKGIARKREDGSFEMTGWCARDMPAVIGYERSYDFHPERWLSEPTINRGNDEEHAGKNGWPHIVNSFFSAVKLLYSLGIRTVYLVGADFRMSIKQPYGFEDEKSKGAVIANNRHFRDMDAMFGALRPHFDKAGFRLYNTYRYSGLTAFPFKDFEEAVDECTRGFPARLDTRGWYHWKPDGDTSSTTNAAGGA